MSMLPAEQVIWCWRKAADTKRAAQAELRELRTALEVRRLVHDTQRQAYGRYTWWLVEVQAPWAAADMMADLGWSLHTGDATP